MKITCFKSIFKDATRDIDLLSWLHLTIKPTKKLKKQVDEYRKTGNKKIKEKIPAVTLSATFKSKRNLKNINKKTGLICLDIDRGDNLCINMEAVKELLSKHPSCLYCGFSTGGDGIYSIMLLAKKNKLSEYFEIFKSKLAKVGVNIDESCKDFTRLRFFSYDKKAYLNENALPYKIISIKRNKKPSKSTHKSSIDKIESLIKAIQGSGTDITQNYQDWVKLGAAINNEFGDSGSHYFHQISKQHSEYDFKKCERKYNNCKKMTSVSFGSLFHIASGYGIRY